MPANLSLRSRRSALRRLARTAGITPFVAAWQPLAQAQSLPPTPSCGPSESPTASQTEGPFYKRSTPQRNSLIELGMPGERLMLSGYVMTTGCRPLPDTVLDFWQADATGQYDNEGYRLRGHVVADAHGRYRLETIIPGGYPGRTRHLHVKLQPPQGRVLTTQLYFPDEPLNLRDAIYTPALQMKLARGGEAAQGTGTVKNRGVYAGRVALPIGRRQKRGRHESQDPRRADHRLGRVEDGRGLRVRPADDRVQR